ncbi:Transposable element Tc1 transposase, partial [Stegodyphus mimosarum]
MVVGARRMCHSIWDIVREFNVPKSTVSRVCREYLISGITSHHGQRSGQPPALNDRDQRRLRRVVSVHRQATLRQITEEINVGRTRDVSDRTLRRNLSSLGYASRRPTRGPLLTARHRLQRLSWAREHIGWSLNEGKTVAWSDESRFQLVRADVRVRVWHRSHEAMDPSCQQSTVQAGGVSIMVWDVFTWHGLGPLVQLNRLLTGNGYVQLLGVHLQPFMDFTYSNNDGIFMDDNAPCHRATIVRDWLEEHSGQFPRMIWPPRSSDMNPIEHLWDIIERSLVTTFAAFQEKMEGAVNSVKEEMKGGQESVKEEMKAVQEKIEAGQGEMKREITSVIENKFEAMEGRIDAVENKVEHIEERVSSVKEQ